MGCHTIQSGVRPGGRGGSLQIWKPLNPIQGSFAGWIILTISHPIVHQIHDILIQSSWGLGTGTAAPHKEGNQILCNRSHLSYHMKIIQKRRILRLWDKKSLKNIRSKNTSECFKKQTKNRGCRKNAVCICTWIFWLKNNNFVGGDGIKHLPEVIEY